MNIPGWGCRSWYSSPPTSFPHFPVHVHGTLLPWHQPLLRVGTRVSFTRALIYLCTRIGHFHSRSLLMASRIFRKEGEKREDVKRRDTLLGAFNT